MKFYKDILNIAVAAMTAVGTLLPCAAQKIDLSKKPEPSPLKNVPFPKYEEKSLKNGLKVIIIEDHEQPTVALRLQLTPGDIADGTKNGMASTTVNMLSKGAGKRSALELAQALDGVGSGFNGNASGDAITGYMSGIKKHLPLMLEILSDMIVRPTFPADEFEKLRTQEIENVRYEKSQPSSVLHAMARKTVYGEKHPYANRENEQTLQSLTLEDIKNFHATYFKPGNASLVVVGDITSKEILPMLEKAFADWKKGISPALTIPKAQSMPIGVYFIERPGSIQSSFTITAPTEPYNHPDYEKISLTADVIGSGFAGRLFKTLREKYSYTYTPYGFATRAKYINRFVSGADVRNSVTDSAIIVTRNELKRLATEPPSDAELSVLKRYTVGTYLMSFEKTEQIANLIQSLDIYDIPVQRLKDYPAKIMAITPQQITQTAAKYMMPEKTQLVVVGSKEVLPKLQQFGPIYRYNLDLEPVREMAMEDAGISADELMQRHIKALGGQDAIKKITSLITNAQATLSAGPQNFKGTIVTKQKTPGMLVSAMDLTVIKHNDWTRGNSAWASDQGAPPKEQTGKELETAKYQADIFPTAHLKEMGYSTQLAGKKNGEFILQITSPLKEEKTLYFDVNTYMVSRIDYVEQSEQGTAPVSERYGDYKEESGAMLPHSFTLLQGPITLKTVNTFKVNEQIDDKEFLPPQGK